MQPPFNQTDGVILELNAFDRYSCIYGVSIPSAPPPGQAINPDGNWTLYYLGVCKITKVYQTPDAWRNSEYQRTITANTTIKINILATHESEAPLYNRLSQLVRQFAPHCNRVGFNQSHTRTVIHCVQGINAGVVYETQAQAARQNGIAQPTLANHLNGVRGYETIRGMIFKRGMPDKQQ